MDWAGKFSRSFLVARNIHSKGRLVRVCTFEYPGVDSTQLPARWGTVSNALPKHRGRIGYNLNHLPNCCISTLSNSRV